MQLFFVAQEGREIQQVAAVCSLIPSGFIAQRCVLVTADKTAP
jgi:hypothetical protein